MMNPNVKNINTTALAYMGDAVYEVYVRKYVMETGQVNADKLHAMAVPFVRAAGQAFAVKKLMNEFLTEEEISLTKRARNHKTASKPKNANPIEYKLATAFEALIGYLYLDGQTDRLEEVIYKAIDIIKETGAKK